MSGKPGTQENDMRMTPEARYLDLWEAYLTLVAIRGLPISSDKRKAE